MNVYSIILRPYCNKNESRRVIHLTQNGIIANIPDNVIFQPKDLAGNTCLNRPGGGIGRRAGLKNLSLTKGEGSIPSPAT